MNWPRSSPAFGPCAIARFGGRSPSTSAITKRLSLTQDFTPTDDEQRLYGQVSEYLQEPGPDALPNGQRQLITLVLRKILASSSFAIGATLGTMINRLKLLQDKAPSHRTSMLKMSSAKMWTTPPMGLEEEWRSR